MKLFAQLYNEIDRTNRTAEKVAALTRYFRSAPPRDAAWAVFVLSGRKIGRTLPSRLIQEWACELSGQPAWLFDECHRIVGDLSETISLLVPDPADGKSPPLLHDVIEQRLQLLPRMTLNEQREVMFRTWRELSTEQRLVFHKLLSGNFRVGVSRQLLIRALAEAAEVDASLIAHRLSGNWTPGETAMGRLLSAHDPAAPVDPSLPYPFMLANPLLAPVSSLGEPCDWLIEWKWDGIRAQVIRRSGRTTLWSRGDESVGGAFPELVQAAAALPEGTVLDGEIVAWNETLDRPAPFTRLQRRLNRKSVELSFWPDVPVVFVAFDLLEAAGRDVRSQTLIERRLMLGQYIGAAGSAAGAGSGAMLRVSSELSCTSWEQLADRIEQSRELCVEGAMLKRRECAVRAGPARGDLVEVEGEAVHHGCGDDRRRGGPRATSGAADGLHLRRVGRKRQTRAGGQGIFGPDRRGNRRGGSVCAPPYACQARAHLRGRTDTGVRAGLRGDSVVQAAPVGNRCQVPAHPPNSRRQEGSRGRPARYAAEAVAPGGVGMSEIDAGSASLRASPRTNVNRKMPGRVRTRAPRGSAALPSLLPIGVGSSAADSLRMLTEGAGARKISPGPTALDHVLEWFASMGREPFAFQQEAWAEYLAGRSGLILAPTGTGKTLAASLGPMIEAMDAGTGLGKQRPLTLLWITPLRALAADTVESLSSALDALGLKWMVELRTADTSASVRRRQKARLPAVLVTTPESMSLLTSYPDSADRLRTVRCIVVDEWHELMASKRGIQVELALARLRTIQPALRVWGLSATVAHVEHAAAALLGPGPARSAAIIRCRTISRSR